MAATIHLDISSTRAFVLILCIFIVVNGTYAVPKLCNLNSDTTMECFNHIPDSIPDGIVKVVLKDFPTGIIVTTDMFAGEGWNRVDSLSMHRQSETDTIRLDDECFQKLTLLEELHIHIVTISVHSGAFKGLKGVKVFDLTNATRIASGDLKRAVLVDGVLPNLEQLILSRSGYVNGLLIDEDFWKQIENRPIWYLDMSYTQAKLFNFTSMLNHCTTLRQLIFRGIYLQTISWDNVKKPLCNVEVIDLSYVYVPSLIYCSMSLVSDIHVKDVDLNRFSPMVNVRELIWNNMCAATKGPMHYFKQIRNISFVSNSSWSLTSLSFNDNRLAYLDVEIVCQHPMLDSLSISGNLLEYINPKLMHCLSTLTNLDISGNRLSLMCIRNSSQFETLFEPLTILKNISLARNGLTTLPNIIFTNTSDLEIIDLSGNSLAQVSFKLSHLERLSILNISDNDISRLDGMTMGNLDSILNLGKVEVDLRGNPLTCSTCEDLQSIKWFVKTKSQLSFNQDVTCRSDRDKDIVIDAQTVEVVQDICERTKRIIIWTTVGCLSLCLIVTLLAMLWRRVLSKRKEYRRRHLINKITSEQPGFEFVAFLSYSSADHDTVERYVIPPLEKTLQQMVGVERSLLCLWDYQYRAGFSIHDENVRCLNRSCVAIFVVSDSFCRSNYCQHEFIQANEMGKPVILMIKEACDEELMPPLLKEVFQKNTRVVWLSDGENFTLKNTWEHVCDSVLTLASSLD